LEHAKNYSRAAGTAPAKNEWGDKTKKLQPMVINFCILWHRNAA